MSESSLLAERGETHRSSKVIVVIIAYSDSFDVLTAVFLPFPWLLQKGGNEHVKLRTPIGWKTVL